jgi:peptidoglycan/LPS O-acetylase OafA/YrhL
MKHIRSIDGLRAWLAWMVVVSHIALLSAVGARLPRLQHALDTLATGAVSIFIIISGFVITHLLIEKRERYLPYLSRRWLRVYPIYLVCLGLGVLASPLHFAAFAARPWGDALPQPELMNAELANLHSHGSAGYLLTHLTLLHGAISNHVLGMSQYMFLGPAWSLSLEWQFYIVAPLILFGLRHRRGQLVVALLTVAAYAAYRRGWLGDFIDPSFLPGAAPYFAAGVMTRLAFPRLPPLRVYPAATLIVGAGLCILARGLTPFLLWAAFIAWLKLDAPTDACSAQVDRWLGLAFNSTPARYLGIRSYSTYLIHEPIINILVYLCVRPLGLGMWSTTLIAIVLTPLLTAAASVALYRYIEAPAIAFGKRAFADSAPAPAAQLPHAAHGPPMLRATAPDAE